MIFLISYDRKTLSTTWLGEYSNDHMDEAQRDRLQAELQAKNLDDTPEIVILRAPSKDSLRATHARYFGKGALEADLQDVRRP